MDADQRQRARSGIFLDDLVRDPHQSATHVVTIENDLFGLVCHSRSFLASRDRVKGTDAASVAGVADALWVLGFSVPDA